MNLAGAPSGTHRTRRPVGKRFVGRAGAPGMAWLVTCHAEEFRR